MEEGLGNGEQGLPHDLIAHQILTKLPIKNLLRLKTVSKEWYSTLSSYQFALIFSKLSSSFHHTCSIEFLFIQHGSDYYLYFYDEDDQIDTTNKNLVKLGFDFDVSIHEKLNLIGSCNGLLCLASYYGNYFILWNPITGQFRKYFDNELVIDSSFPVRMSWGFGYDSDVDDYKVVRILELAATLQIKVHVFSLKSNKWKRIDQDLYQDIFSLNCMSRSKFQFSHNATFAWFPFTFHRRQGVMVDETLYWVVYKSNDWGRKVVSFDLVSEEFNTIADLNMVSTCAYDDKFLCVLGGCLSKCGVNMRDDVNVEMLESPGKVKSIRLFRDLGLSSCQDIVGFTRTGKFFILLGNSILGLVDPSSRPMKCVRLVEFDSSSKSRVASYVPSLTLPYTINV